MPLINCKIYFQLNWTEDCIVSSNGTSGKFEITGAKLHVPVVILSTKDNVNLTKQLSNGFKGSVYWNGCQIIPAKVIEKGKIIYESLSASFKGVKRLFVLAYFVAASVAPAVTDHTTGIKNSRKYFLLKEETNNDNLLIDGRNF